MGTGTVVKIPTTDIIPETMEIFGYQTDNIPVKWLFEMLDLIEISPYKCFTKLCFFFLIMTIYRIEKKRFEKNPN